MSENNVTQVLVNAKGLLSWTRNRLEADIMWSLVRELENALDGLYKVYVNLGEDTDGARNAKELFGPWVGFDPATHIPKLVAEHRDEWEHAYEEGVEDGKREAYDERHGR